MWAASWRPGRASLLGLPIERATLRARQNAGCGGTERTGSGVLTVLALFPIPPGMMACGGGAFCGCVTVPIQFSAESISTFLSKRHVRLRTGTHLGNSKK
jgi:hypothetical protein